MSNVEHTVKDNIVTRSKHHSNMSKVNQVCCWPTVYSVTSKNHGNMSKVEHTERDNIVTCPMQVAQASGSSK